MIFLASFVLWWSFFLYLFQHTLVILLSEEFDGFVDSFEIVHDFLFIADQLNDKFYYVGWNAMGPRDGHELVVCDVFVQVFLGILDVLGHVIFEDRVEVKCI